MHNPRERAKYHLLTIAVHLECSVAAWQEGRRCLSGIDPEKHRYSGHTPPAVKNQYVQGQSTAVV